MACLGLIEALAVASHQHHFARVGRDRLDAALLLVAATNEKTGLGSRTARAPMVLHGLLLLVQEGLLAVAAVNSRALCRARVVDHELVVIVHRADNDYGARRAGAACLLFDDMARLLLHGAAPPDLCRRGSSAVGASSPLEVARGTPNTN